MKSRTLLSATIYVAGVTLLIRVLGLLRDSLLAGRFGIGEDVDEFFIILAWGNFLTSVFATSGINVMIPRLKSAKTIPDEFTFELAHHLLIFTLGLVFISVLTGCLFVGFSHFPVSLIFFGVLIFIFQSLNHFITSILNLYNVFVRTSFYFGIPICITLTAFVLNSLDSFTLLSFFVLGCFVQLISLGYLLGQHISQTRFLTSRALYFVSSELKNWFGIALATFYFPASELLIVQLSTYLGDGAVAMSGYAARVPFALSSLVIYAVWTVFLPNMRLEAGKLISRRDLLRTLKVCSVALIVSLVTAQLSPWIVDVIYGHGKTIDALSLQEIIKMQRNLIYTIPLQIFVNLALRFLHANGKIWISIFFAMVGIGVQAVYCIHIDKSLNGLTIGFLANFAIVLILLLSCNLIAGRRRAGFGNSSH